MLDPALGHHDTGTMGGCIGAELQRRADHVHRDRIIELTPFEADDMQDLAQPHQSERQAAVGITHHGGILMPLTELVERLAQAGLGRDDEWLASRERAQRGLLGVCRSQSIRGLGRRAIGLGHAMPPA